MAPPQQLRHHISNCSLLLIYRPRKDERLSWPGRLTYSGWFTHISDHPSATGRVQDIESTPAKGRRSTAGPRNHSHIDVAGEFENITCEIASRMFAINVLPTQQSPAWSSSGRHNYESRESEQQTYGLTENKPFFIRNSITLSPVRGHLGLQLL